MADDKPEANIWLCHLMIVHVQQFYSVNKFPTSVEEIYVSQILVQPNPATNYCSIVTSNLAGQNGFINISDASGKTIYSQIINADRIDIATDNSLSA
nr:hypothetical protein [Bacteroidota bacterium]